MESWIGRVVTLAGIGVLDIYQSSEPLLKLGPPSATAQLEVVILKAAASHWEVQH